MVRGREPTPAAALGHQGSAAAVMIRHDDDCWTVYANLTEVLVRMGDHVEAGRTLGLIGDWRQLEPGHSAHLHFEVLERRGTGAVPLFGPIERCYCRDPEAWLRRHGVEYNGCGRLIRRA